MTDAGLRQKCIEAMKAAVPPAIQVYIGERWLDEILNDLFDAHEAIAAAGNLTRKKMTKDELRHQCIDAMVVAFDNSIGAIYDGFESPRSSDDVYEAIEAAFDAQHGLVRVVPIEATEEMIEAGNNCGDWGPGINCDDSDASPENCWRAMAAAGDLTRPR